MTTLELLLTVGIVAAVTLGTRLIAFLLFPAGKQAPDFVVWLGKRLPGAVMMMLVIYCFKDVSFIAAQGWIPAFAGAGITAVLQLWKKQMFLSIAAGTAVYMLLIRVMGA